jgi:hypothetical protein
MLKTFAHGLAAACALAATAVHAQTLNPSGERFVRSGTGHPIAPGAYAIVPGHSGLCLTSANLVLSLPATRTPFMTQITCPSASGVFSVGQVEVIAQPDGGYALQPAGVSGCATVARGVVFGPAAIDILPCGGLTGRAIDPDQRFTFRVIDPNPAFPAVEIRAPNGECWDVREGSRSPGAELIRFACNNQGNQVFRLRFMGVPTRPGTLAAAEAVNWFAQRSPAAMISVVETPAINFFGADYMPGLAGLTLAQCKARCADDTRCRSMSLVRDVGAGTRCWLKSGIPGPNADANVASAVTRP